MPIWALKFALRNWFKFEEHWAQNM
eukprot:COSAG02_NODE_47322_length_342_cov_0.637860_1_plen_24_part_01